jgi:hypothetical protein
MDTQSRMPQARGHLQSFVEVREATNSFMFEEHKKRRVEHAMGPELVKI